MSFQNTVQIKKNNLSSLVVSSDEDSDKETSGAGAKATGADWQRELPKDPFAVLQGAANVLNSLPASPVRTPDIPLGEPDLGSNPDLFSLAQSLQSRRRRRVNVSDTQSFQSLPVQLPGEAREAHITHRHQFVIPDRLQQFFENICPLIRAAANKIAQHYNHEIQTSRLRRFLGQTAVGVFTFTVLLLFTIMFAYLFHVIEGATQNTAVADFAFVWKNLFAFIVYHVCKRYFWNDTQSSMLFILLVVCGHYIPDVDLIAFSNHKEIDNLPVLDEFDKSVYEKNPDFHALSMFNELFVIRSHCGLDYSTFKMSNQVTEKCLMSLAAIFDIFDEVYLPAFMKVTSNKKFNFPPFVHSSLSFSINENKSIENIYETLVYEDVHAKPWDPYCFKNMTNCSKVFEMLCFLDRRMQNGHVFNQYYKDAKRLAMASQKVFEKSMEVSDSIENIPAFDSITTVLTQNHMWAVFARDGLKLFNKAKGYYLNYELIMSFYDFLGTKNKTLQAEYIANGAVPKMKEMLGSVRYIEWENETYRVNFLLRQYDGRKYVMPNVRRLKLTAGNLIFQNAPVHDYQKFINGLENSHFDNCPFKNVDDGMKLFKSCDVMPAVCVQIANNHVAHQLKTIEANFQNAQRAITVNALPTMRQCTRHPNNITSYTGKYSNMSFENCLDVTEVTKSCPPCVKCPACTNVIVNVPCHEEENNKTKTYDMEICRSILGLAPEDRSLAFSSSWTYVLYAGTFSVVRASPAVFGTCKGLKRTPLKVRAILSLFWIMMAFNFYNELNIVENYVKETVVNLIKYTGQLAWGTFKFVQRLFLAGAPVAIGGALLTGVIYLNACQVRPFDTSSWRTRVTDWKTQVSDWWSGNNPDTMIAQEDFESMALETFEREISELAFDN